MSKRTMTGSGAAALEVADAMMSEAELVVMSESLNKGGVMLDKDIIAEVMERTRDFDEEKLAELEEQIKTLKEKVATASASMAT